MLGPDTVREKEIATAFIDDCDYKGNEAIYLREASIFSEYLQLIRACLSWHHGELQVRRGFKSEHRIHHRSTSVCSKNLPGDRRAVIPTTRKKRTIVPAVNMS